MKNQIQAHKKGKSKLQSQQTKKFNRSIHYVADLTRRKHWLPILKKYLPGVRHIAAKLEWGRGVSDVIYTAVAFVLLDGEKNIAIAKEFPGHLDPSNYSFFIGNELAGLNVIDMEARLDALAARIEKPVQLVLSNAIKGFLDFAIVNHMVAAEGMFLVSEAMERAGVSGKQMVKIMVPFSDSELSKIDQACATLKINRDELMRRAVIAKIQHEEAA